TVLPASARVCTALLTLGFQEVARPVLASRAAILFLGCPPMLLGTTSVGLKVPPTYTMFPDTAIDSTELLELGFQPVAVPLFTCSAAMRLREVPPVWLQ